MSDISRLKDSLTDRYAVDREIGRGGMATVYLARDVRHDRQVALKVLDSELGAVLGAASVSTTPDFAVESRAVIIDGNYAWGAGHANYDVASDGESLLLLRPVPGYEEQVIVVHNWITELRVRRRGQSAVR